MENNGGFMKYFYMNMDMLFLIFNSTKKIKKAPFYIGSFLNNFSAQLINQKLIISTTLTAFS